MQNLIKQYIYTMLTPPKHISELLEFVEDNYKQGKITLFGRLLALFNNYGFEGTERVAIKSTINCMVCNEETEIEVIENKLCPDCKDVLEFSDQSFPSYKLEKIEHKLNKKLVSV